MGNCTMLMMRQVTSPNTPLRKYQVVWVITTLLQRHKLSKTDRVEKTVQDRVGCIIKKQREKDKYLHIAKNWIFTNPDNLHIKERRLQLEEKMAETESEHGKICRNKCFPHYQTLWPVRPDCHNSNSTQCTLWFLFKKHLLINLTMANIIMDLLSTHKADCMHYCQHQRSFYNETTSCNMYVPYSGKFREHKF